MRHAEYYWQHKDGEQRGPSTFVEYKAACGDGRTHAKCLVYAAGVTPSDAWKVLSDLPELLHWVLPQDQVRDSTSDARKVRFQGDGDIVRSNSASDARPSRDRSNARRSKPLPKVERTSPSRTRKAAHRDLANAGGSPLRGRVRASHRAAS